MVGGLGDSRVGLGDGWLRRRGRKSDVRNVGRDVFQHQTPAGLARIALPVANDDRQAGGSPTGPLPATPIVAEFLADPRHGDAFHQTMLLTLPETIGREDLTAVLQAVLDHHHALRLRVEEDGSLFIPEPGTLRCAVDQDVTHMQCESKLDQGQEEEYQEASDQREIHYCRTGVAYSAAVAGPGSFRCCSSGHVTGTRTASKEAVARRHLALGQGTGAFRNLPVPIAT